MMLAGWINPHQQDVIMYLKEKNKILRERLDTGCTCQAVIGPPCSGPMRHKCALESMVCRTRVQGEVDSTALVSRMREKRRSVPEIPADSSPIQKVKVTPKRLHRVPEAVAGGR